MKKKLFLLLMIVMLPVLCFGIGLSHKGANTLVVYAETAEVAESEVIEGEVVEETPETEKSDWELYFEDKILPILISVGTSIMTLLVAIGPILTAVKNGAKLFGKAKDSLKDSTETSIKATSDMLKEMHENSELVRELRAELEKMKNDMRAELTECKKHAENAVEIAKIGFGNTTELVKNGYANAIQKVGQNEETKESEEN